MEKNNKKILIVEDDKDILFILKKRFAIEGFSVITATDGEEAITIAENTKPDLIISDVLMPKLGGLEMAEKIKEFNKDIKIMFLTNIKDAEYIDKIEKSGNSDYLIKSELRIDEIVDKVKIKLDVK
ncbi:MAG: response regulator [bacterium]|nr:response regulator [bacterium]